MKKLSHLARITEVDDVSDRLLIVYEKETSLQDDEFLKTTFDEIKVLSDELTKAIRKDASLSKLEEADFRRDELIRSLNNVLLGYSSMVTPSIKENGDKLYEVFMKYGVKITKENYSSKSSLIESLINDLEAPELSEAVMGLVGVSEVIEKLKNEQKAFTSLRVDYNNELAVQKNSKKASEIRKPLIEIINKKIIPYISAMSIANNGKYLHFYNVVSEVIDNMNTSVKRRTTSKGMKTEVVSDKEQKMN